MGARRLFVQQRVMKCTEGARRLFVQQRVIWAKFFGIGVLATSLAACATNTAISTSGTAGGALVVNQRMGDGIGIGTGLSNARIRTPKPTREPGFAPADRTPADDTTESEVGVYTLPLASTEPLGELSIEMLGNTQISLGSQAPEAPTAEALQVRFKVENSSTNDWTLDTRLQTLSVGEISRLRPTFARADQVPPFIEIPAGESREVELFYVLPEDEPSASASDRILISWSVLTDGGVESEVATFRPVGRASISATTQRFAPDEFQTEPPSEQPYATPLLGPSNMPFWWRDPFAPTPYLWRDLIY